MPDPAASVDRTSSSADGLAPLDRARLDRRYGRTATRLRWNKRVAWIVAGGFVVVFTAWVIWGGIDGATSEVDVLDVGHQVMDDSSVSVTWQLTIDQGESARCVVQAQNEAHAIVGWKTVDVPASDQRTRKLTEVVNATEQPVTGLIWRCWPA